MLVFTCFWWEGRWAELGRQCRGVMWDHMVRAKYPEIGRYALSPLRGL